MEIRKDSWHYMFWARTYNPKPLLCNPKYDCAPYRTSLCAYVNRIIWVAPCIYLFAGLAWTWVGLLMLLCVLVYTIGALLAPIVGRYYDLKKNSWNKYRSPIKIVGLGIYPYHLLMLGLIWAIATKRIIIPEVLYWIALWVVMFIVVNGLVHFAVTYRKLNPPKENHSGTITLATAYLKAKKDRICPVVTFTDPAESSS